MHDHINNDSPCALCDDLSWHIERPDRESAISHSGEVMISILDAVVMFSFGVGAALFCVFAGAILHMRFLDRKLIPPVPKAPITRQIPTVKP